MIHPPAEAGQERRGQFSSANPGCASLAHRRPARLGRRHRGPCALCWARLASAESSPGSPSRVAEGPPSTAVTPRSARQRAAGSHFRFCLGHFPVIHSGASKTLPGPHLPQFPRCACSVGLSAPRAIQRKCARPGNTNTNRVRPTGRSHHPHVVVQWFRLWLVRLRNRVFNFYLY